MKTFNTTQMAKTVLVACLGALMLANVGCGNNKSKEASVADARGVRGNSEVTAMGIPVGQTASEQSPAVVVGQDQNSFKSEIDALLAPFMSTSDYGDVNYQSGLRIRGYVELDQRGNVLTTNSESAVVLTIQDSFVGQTVEETGEVVDVINMKVPARSGTAYNGVVNITFADEYGTITVSGNWNNAGTLTGTVSYQYNQSKSAKKSGTLGRFSMPVCNFFKCQK